MSICVKEVNKYLSAIKHGDQTSFKPLYDSIATRVMGIAMYYLIDKSYCEDVMNEAFQNVYLYINSYDESKDGYNWICRITENVAYKYNNRMPPPSDDLSKADSDIGKLAISDDTEEKLDLFRAIDSLEPESREVVYMYYFLGNSYQDIGDRLHISRVAVKKKLDRILSKIKKYLETGKC